MKERFYIKGEVKDDCQNFGGWKEVDYSHIPEQGVCDLGNSSCENCGSYKPKR